MMNLTSIQRVYFIGIGGIGMSAIARFFLQRGATVSGYDKTRTPLTSQLESEGMKIHYSEDLSLLDKEAQIIVYTPAIPSGHTELIWYRENNYPVLKRSDVLQIISNEMQALCVSGTHGKTTVSTMIAHILRASGYGCNAFLGGISANYGVNYWSSERACAVIEADEYDRSFLKLNPYITVVTAMDPDHLDIYGTVEEMERCYIEFISKTQQTLLFKHGLKHALSFRAPQKLSYSIQNDAADYYVKNMVMHHGCYRFTLCYREEELGNVALNIGGMHNVENAVVAMAACSQLGVEMSEIINALASFTGVKRRFEYILNDDKRVMIDDYAHHPEELRMLLKSAKALFQTKKLSVVFQPHLFTRTRDLADGFAESLDMADEIILLDIYPARELPIEGVTSDMILQRMTNPVKHILSKEGLLRWVKLSQPELLVTAGAGDIDALVEPIKNLLNHNTQ